LKRAAEILNDEELAQILSYVLGLRKDLHITNKEKTLGILKSYFEQFKINYVIDTIQNL
jgi:hypothetical protein